MNRDLHLPAHIKHPELAGKNVPHHRLVFSQPMLHVALGVLHPADHPSPPHHLCRSSTVVTCSLENAVMSCACSSGNCARRSSHSSSYRKSSVRLRQP